MQVSLDNTSEIYVRGKWIQVPSLAVDDKTIVVGGSWLKMARIRSEEWLETEVEDPERCVQELKRQRKQLGRADVFTFTQKPDATAPKYHYPMEWESVAAIHLISFEDWWEKLPQATRKNVRRSQKRGVTVTVSAFDDELIQQLVQLNNDTPMRQGAFNKQYGKTFEQVRKDHSSFLDRSDCICAYCDDELAGFLKIVYRGNVASIINFLPNARHDDKRPGNALMARALELCAAKGISYLTYGLFDYGNKRDSPLREFKIRNGFSGLLVPRYFVPLTWWGALCVRLKLHRGLLGILPDWAITMLINARTKWNHFKESFKPV